jgi:hypothetical protein
VSTQVCIFFVAVAITIVAISIRTRTSWFRDLSDLSGDDSAMPSDFMTAAPHSEPDPHAGFGAIQDADPGFTIDGFRARVEEMFLAYHKALESGDLASTRSFIDPRFYAQLLEEKGAAHPADRPPVVTGVRDVRPAIARHDDGMDLVRSTVVGTTVSGDPLVEHWELIRRRGATTKPKMTIYKCPNCGGPVDGKDATRCAYCQTILADPALDWVVRRISGD